MPKPIREGLEDGDGRFIVLIVLILSWLAVIWAEVLSRLGY